MKKLIVTACAAIASAVALASTVESSNVFGVLKVSLANSKPESQKQYFISVPWEKVGATGTSINPTDLVLTTGLEDGDHLFAYGQSSESSNSSKFGAWKFDGTGWTAADVIETINGESITHKAGTITGVPRGQGLILETKATTVYLSGQYATGGSVTIVPGAYTLIGGATAAECVLSTSAGATTGEGLTVTWSGTPTAGDEIFVGDQRYYYKNSKWVKTKTTESIGQDNFEAASVVIPAGRGAWYSSQASSGTLKITFN